MKPVKTIIHIFIFTLLTVLTQIGGVVYLLAFLTHPWIERKTIKKTTSVLLKCTTFMLLYAACTFGLVPLLAKPFGRVPLPLKETNHLKPLTVLTWVLNRQYVRPQLKDAAERAAQNMHKKFPGTTINYLDANFPFINKFPLLPHLSHNDGKKLDLAFCYKEAATNKETNDCPSAIGYGICEEPLPGEKNTAAFCAAKGYWNYSFLTHVVPQENKNNFLLDGSRTRELVLLLTSEPAIGKIFIEPHLVKRLDLHADKIRFHGCQAVRHDDHIHIQLK